MCQTKLQYKARRFREQRLHARLILRALARHAPDLFTEVDFRRAVGMDASGHGPADWYVFQFLQQHGFVSRWDAPKTGRKCRFFLTEQAIRWLDWTGFDWKAA